MSSEWQYQPPPPPAPAGWPGSSAGAHDVVPGQPLQPAFAGAPTAGHPQPWPGPPPHGWPAPVPSGHDGLAIASLVLGLLWLVGLGSVAAVVTGHLSHRRAHAVGRSASGLATAGLVLGYLGIVMLPLAAAIAIPVYLQQQSLAETFVVKSELREAAMAQEKYWFDHGAYTSTLPGDLYSSDPATPVVVVRADETSYCLSARTATSEVWYFDPQAGPPSTVPCDRR